MLHAGCIVCKCYLLLLQAINLAQHTSSQLHAAVSIAELATNSLELVTLSALTGNPEYGRRALRCLSVLNQRYPHQVKGVMCAANGWPL